MSFFYNLVGAHTPKQKLIFQSIFLVISLIWIGFAIIHGESVFWFAYWSFTGILCGYNIIGEYYEMKREAVES